MANRNTRRLALVIVGGALTVVLAFVAAGCGGSSAPKAQAGAQATTTSGSGSGQGAGNRSAAFQAFTSCLQQHGIKSTGFGGFGGRFRNRTGTNPTPPSGGSGTQTTPRRPNLTPAQQKAYTACRSKLPSGGNFGRGGFGGGGGSRGGSSPAFAKYTNCLKQHGVTFGKSSSAKAFQKAETACAKLRPTFGAGGSTTTTNAGA